MKVKFWGVRGSIPSPGPNTVKYGGNTACIEVEINEDYSVVFDAGSGIRNIGLDYLKNKIMKGKKVRMSLFVTHTHWDHIQGFPFFVPAFIPGTIIDIYGASKVNAKLDEVLKGQQEYNYFPIALDEMKSVIRFNEVGEGEPVYLPIDFAELEKCVKVTNAKLNHPYPGVFAYRLDYLGKSIVIATDTEHYSTPDIRLLNLAQGADYMVYDCQYSEAIYNQGKNLGWGHSTPDKGIEVCKLAGVKNFIMFHYDPNSSDEVIDKMLADARDKYATVGPDIIAAQEGMVIEI